MVVAEPQRATITALSAGLWRMAEVQKLGERNVAVAWEKGRGSGTTTERRLHETWEAVRLNAALSYSHPKTLITYFQPIRPVLSGVQRLNIASAFLRACYVLEYFDISQILFKRHSELRLAVII